MSVFALLLASAFWTVEVLAATKSTTTYRIQRAWFDPENVYVVYKKDITKQHYSLGDVHGTIENEKESVWIARLPRAQLADEITLELKEDEPAESIIYRDNDFTISKANSESILSGREISGTLPICEEKRDTGWPIRWQTSMLYCGALYSLSGHQEWVLPVTVLQAINTRGNSSHRSALEGLGRRKPVFCTEDGKQFVVASALGNSATLQLGNWTVGQSEISWNELPVGPQGATASVANGVLAYSPYRIVLAVELGQNRYWAQCHESKCDIIEKLVVDDSYLLFDAKAREAISLSIPTSTRPEVRVHLVKF